MTSIDVTAGLMLCLIRVLSHSSSSLNAKQHAICRSANSSASQSGKKHSGKSVSRSAGSHLSHDVSCQLVSLRTLATTITSSRRLGGSSSVDSYGSSTESLLVADLIQSPCVTTLALDSLSCKSSPLLLSPCNYNIKNPNPQY